MKTKINGQIWGWTLSGIDAVMKAGKLLFNCRRTKTNLPEKLKVKV